MFAVAELGRTEGRHLFRQPLLSSARSSALLFSGATPVQDQPDPNESHGTCYNLGKKNRSARWPFRRDTGDHHGSQSDRESQQAGNPYSWFPARHQYDLIATLAIGPVSEFDGRGVHIEEWNEVQNNRHRDQKLVCAQHRGSKLREDQDQSRDPRLDQNRDPWCFPAWVDLAEEGRQ